MPKSIFVSYDGDDMEWLDKLSDWEERGLLGDNVRITAERDDFRPQGNQAVKNELKSLIQGADTVLVLVGDNTHNRPWVDYEIDVANAKHKRVIPVRIPGTTGAAPKKLRSKEEVVMDPSSIKKRL